jgi:hypothetical protein
LVIMFIHASVTLPVNSGAVFSNPTKNLKMSILPNILM